MVQIQYIDTQFAIIICTIVWFIFAYLAEWKKDFMYCLFSTLLSIEMAYLFLSINQMFTVIFILASGYFGFLFIAFIPFLKKYTTYLLEKLDLA